VTEPDFSPRADGAEAAISAGRRRRTQRQLGGAGGAAALALVAVLVATHPFASAGGTDSLRVAGDPTASGEPSPGAAEPTANPTHAPTPEPTTTDRTGGGPIGSGSGYGDPGSVDPTTAPEPSSSPDTPDRVSQPPTRTTVVYTSDPDCEQQPALPTDSPWCLRYSGDPTVKRGGVATISADLCRLPGRGAGQWQFDDADGMWLEVRDSSNTDVKWSSQDGRKVAAEASTVTVAAGTCLRFTTTWDTRDRDGFRVRPGDYNVNFAASGRATADNYPSSSGDVITVQS
jgi:hypothetical protein